MDDNGSRKRYSGEQKMGALKRHFLEGKSISEVCRELDISPTQFYRWQKEMFDQGARVFEPHTARSQDKRPQERIAALEARLKKKDEVIAELMEEHLALKKSFGET